MSRIETARLLLRPMTGADAPDVLAYSRDPEVGPSAGWKPHENIKETWAVMSEVFLDKPEVYGIVLKEAGKLIGSIGLIADPKRQNERARMLGYAIAKPLWGQGLMTEAAQVLLQHGFRDLKLDLISAYCYPENVRSQHVLLKLGFQHEGTLRQCEERYDGLVFDNACYALLPNA